MITGDSENSANPEPETPAPDAFCRVHKKGIPPVVSCLLPPSGGGRTRGILRLLFFLTGVMNRHNRNPVRRNEMNTTTESEKNTPLICPPACFDKPVECAAWKVRL